MFKTKMDIQLSIAQWCFKFLNGYSKEITPHYAYETIFREKLNYYNFSRIEKSQLALNKNSNIRNPEIKAKGSN